MNSSKKLRLWIVDLSRLRKNFMNRFLTKGRLMFYPALLFLIIINAIPQKIGIDKEIKPFVKSVKEVSKGNLDGSNLHINFGKPFGKKNIGTCYWWRNEVILDKAAWDRRDWSSRVILLAHEIGHCNKMQLMHINGVDDMGCAKHFMHWQDSGAWCNRVRFEKYKEQMRKL